MKIKGKGGVFEQNHKNIYRFITMYWGIFVILHKNDFN